MFFLDIRFLVTVFVSFGTIFYWCSSFHWHSSFFNHEHNSKGKVSMKGSITCSWAVWIVQLYFISLSKTHHHWLIRKIRYFLFQWNKIDKNVLGSKYPLLHITKITGLTPPHNCTCSKPGPGFSTSYVMGLSILNNLSSDVIFCFVDMDEIFEHHCLDFFSL